MFSVLGGRAVHEKGVWERAAKRGGRGDGSVMTLTSIGKRWRGSERVLRAGRGTRRVLALKALRLLGMAASVS